MFTGVINIKLSVLLITLILCTPAFAGQLKIDPNAQQRYAAQGKSVASAWMIYGLSLADCERSVGARSGYKCEFFARKNVVSIWQELKQMDKSSNRHLDELLRIDQANFFPEYVWVNFKEPSWQQPDNLKIDDYLKWMNKNLPKHKPNKNVGISYKHD